MTEKLKVAVLFGGQSGEYEVSLNSAFSVIEVMDKEKYDILPVGITKDGKWKIFLGDISKIKNDTWQEDAIPALLPLDAGSKCIVSLEQGKEMRYYIDVVFPVLHGPRGEDGTVQGLLELANLPYISCGVTSSALCMDKVFAKKVLEHDGIPVVDYKVFYKNDMPGNLPDMVLEVEKAFGYPCFIKPANLGSSVGISKAADGEELKKGIELAFQYDTKILVEKFISAREIECSVLGNENPKASLPGEIIPSRDFYDYTAKYLDGDKSKLLLPAPLNKAETKEIQDLAIRAYKVLDCSGMARVDFLKSKITGKLYVNELNTIPGFTDISMYPKMWEISGLDYKDLIDNLIELALNRHHQKNLLNLS